MTEIQNTAYVSQAQSALKVSQSQKPAYKSPEAFEGEAKLLKQIYDNYMKNVGGFKYENGQYIHVTTVLHINKNAQNAVLAIEERLRELGELPHLDVQRGGNYTVY